MEGEKLGIEEDEEERLTDKNRRKEREMLRKEYLYRDGILFILFSFCEGKLNFVDASS